MKKYGVSEIEQFLRAVDERLSKPFFLIVVGGSAAALAYRASLTTGDIDTANNVTEIREACDEAARETGLRIPVNLSTVLDGPYHYEDRLQQLEMPGLKHLVIKVPEKHDLVLMKMLRGYAHDIEHIVEIHQNVGLKLEILVERYHTEMGHTMGSRKRIKGNFLAVIESVFGHAVAEALVKQVD